MDRCHECALLTGKIDTVLSHLLELTTAQLEAFRMKDDNAVVRLDKELEQALGREERAFGAQREHAREHGSKIYDEA